MRELAKTMMSVSLGMGLLAVRETSRILSGESPKQVMADTEKFLGDVSKITQDALGEDMRKTFKYGNDMQCRIMDTGMGLLEDGLHPTEMTKTGRDLMKKTTQIFSKKDKPADGEPTPS